ncbi:Membrane protein OxaA [Mycobacteroides abscessus]|nr:Membrane protein OxaA [Mycobacteroides abscessus]
MFDWFNLGFIYYPVSGIMWVWYKLFAYLLGPKNFFAWALSVMFLVFTLRAILYKPFVRQIRTTRQMQELQPQIKALQKKYKNDRQRMALEMQKLQREHGFNPILGCLPMLAQIPVFLGLFHVLRSFNRTTGGFGQVHMTVEANRATGNYFFSANDVANFLDANLFGAPLGATMIQTTGLDAFTEFNRLAVAGVSIPLMIVAGVATYFNSRASIARQSPEAQANPQTQIMNRLALYVFPLGGWSVDRSCRSRSSCIGCRTTFGRSDSSTTSSTESPRKRKKRSRRIWSGAQPTPPSRVPSRRVARANRPNKQTTRMRARRSWSPPARTRTAGDRLPRIQQMDQARRAVPRSRVRGPIVAASASRPRFCTGVTEGEER